jgi:hypothetical protein
MPSQGGYTSAPHCIHLVRFAELELRNAVGKAIWEPTARDFLDALSYYSSDPEPYTGRAQSVGLDGKVSAEGFFVEGRPEGAWTRWHGNGQKREEFFIIGGECCYARHWDENGVPI